MIFLHLFGKALFTVIFRGIFCTRIIGRERVPRTGGLLLVCNHISFVDPPLIGTITPRYVEFMTMLELFRVPVLGMLARWARAFPIDRGRVDHRAAREAIHRLRNNRCVAIFPEGGIRNCSESVLGGNPQIKPGTGVIALLGSAAILPVIVHATRVPYVWKNWFQRPTMSIIFGAPYCLWNPKGLSNTERRQIAHEVVRDQLLKTVELT